MTTYLLRNIPDEAYAQMRIAAAVRRQSVRQFMLDVLNEAAQNTLSSFKGRTPDFGPGDRGSSPRERTKKTKP